VQWYPAGWHIVTCLVQHIYIDVLINQLQSTTLGCFVGNVYIGCIAYADEIILLSSSVCMLQKMLIECVKCGTEVDKIFNARKSC